MPLHAWSSAKYTFPLPDGHRFPIAKYALLRERVLADGIVPPEHMHDPARVTRDDLLLVHTADYVDRFTPASSRRDEERKLGFPWSRGLVERSYRAAGGTLEAARFAVDHGIAMNLAGGTHHAFPDHGEGFCVFNDVAIAIRALQRDGGSRAPRSSISTCIRETARTRFSPATSACSPSACTAAATIPFTRCPGVSTSSSTTEPATTNTWRCLPRRFRACSPTRAGSRRVSRRRGLRTRPTASAGWG